MMGQIVPLGTEIKPAKNIINDMIQWEETGNDQTIGSNYKKTWYDA